MIKNNNIIFEISNKLNKKSNRIVLEEIDTKEDIYP